MVAQAIELGIGAATFVSSLLLVRPPLIKPYVSPEGATALHKYQYSGSDASYIYNYITSPLSKWIADQLPWWIAPNTITVTGLGLVIIAHIVMAWHCPMMEGLAPAWVYWLSFVSLTLYQVLDCTDGKQARRTGNSSPLGLLFDHGCDAMNCILTGMTLASCMQLGATWKSLALVCVGTVPFFCATWEEYFTGTLALPLINGANEGLLGIELFFLSCAIWPQEVHAWTTATNTFFPSICNNTFMICVIGLMAVPTCAENVKNVLRVLYEQNQVGHGGRTKAWMGIAPFIVFWSLVCLWCMHSADDGVDIMARYPRTVLFTAGMFSCKLTMHLMLAHLCDQDTTQQLRKSFVPVLGTAFVIFVKRQTGFGPSVDQDWLVKIAFWLSLTVYWHMVLHVVDELTRVLNIRCFVAKPPPRKAQ